MLKVLRPLKDAYITNRVINGVAQLGANVGAAGSLDLYKLYGFTSSGSVPNTELTRLLVQFDLGPLRQLVAQGALDITNPTFSCHLHLYDVYGGQPTPAGFTVTAYPLSASFDEGHGRDVVLYGDSDVCNWLTSSFASGSWFGAGCVSGSWATNPCDFITASAAVAGGASLRASQFFTTGEEDLDLDVTTVVSATLAGLLPDAGFRIALDAPLEADQHTYFVKRFAARTAFDADVRPRMLVRFDDSVQDDTDNVFFDQSSYLFLYNYARSAPANLVSGSAQVTGSNSFILQLVTPVSGGLYSLYFTGSQHSRGVVPVTGIYSASVSVSSNDSQLVPQLQASGSVTFTPIWRSLDGTVAYLTGSAIKAMPAQRGPSSLDPRKLTVSVLGLRETHRSTESTVLRINLFDYTAPNITAARVPVDLPGISVRDVHYQVRDPDTGAVPVPFDTVTNSTRLSNDASGMYCRIDMADLTPERSYVIDVLVLTGNNQQLFSPASPVFRVSDLR